ncbi:class I SAM-dependent methyltransferase [Hyphobacterium sp. CCMP332]|nr:class I SAM-dependent methyltransferase [Hyphobacterium sp. CCMP332]
MELFSQELLTYIDAHTSSEGDLLKNLDRETNLKVMMPRMLSGKVQGRFLSFISKIQKPRRILEIGTYTGYATICLAEGLAEGGKIYTIDKNIELKAMVEKYFKEAGIADSVNYLNGNAIEIIPELKEEFDLIFIDADKVNYKNYYELCMPRLSKNGLIIADNVLWSGKITDQKADKSTKALQEFNDLVQADNNVENVLLSIRDGLMILRKK